MNDERLRDDVIRAFKTARALYAELASDADHPLTLASRVATDDDIRERLRDALQDLRRAGERLQGTHGRASSRSPSLVVAGLALAALFNPLTGPRTRRFIRDLLSGANRDGSPPPAGDGA